MRVPIGHSIEYVIILLSSLGNISTPTIGVRKIIQNIKNATGINMERRLRKVFFRKYVSNSLYFSIKI